MNQKVWQATAIATLLALPGALFAQPVALTSTGPASEWARGRVLVQGRAGLSDQALDGIVKPHGGKARRVGRSDLHVVDLTPGRTSEPELVSLLSRHPQLKFAELDRRVASAFVSNDAYLGSAWHLSRIGADLAWDSTLGAGITIAILDSGVLATHPDLSLVPGWNFVDNNADTADVNGHGTTVAGAAAAIINNGLGVVGVAGGARVMPIRVADSSGYAYYSTIASGVTYAADRGVRIANASFAGVYASAAVQSAGQYLKTRGGLLVVAAGNSASNDGTAATSSLIPVSATDAYDALASWSSFGSYVAVAAPGVGIWTTGMDGGYRAASGTSYASPITAGVLALMMAARPTLGAAQIESLLYSSAVDLGAAGRDVQFGYGRVNAHAAVSAALGSANTVSSDTEAPAVMITAPLGGSTVSGLVAVDVAASDNVGLSRVELRVNGGLVATDTVSPFQFSWDSTSVPNGGATLVAQAYDAAGNSRASSSLSVNVSNGVVADTKAPVLAIVKPVSDSKVTGTVGISLSASDNSGAAGIKLVLYVDDKVVASGTGASLNYNWNTRKATAGSHTIRAIAQDAAGNLSSTSIMVTK